MNVRVQLFAVARQLAGGRECIEIALPEAATVGQLREALAASFPQLASVLPHVLFAVDAEYASDDRPIPSNAAVACIPPVSGG